MRHGAPSLPGYAPYTAHVLTVEVFFRFAMERGFISRDRASNRVDIAYLHYLPFCHVFVSSDRIHRMTASLFLRDYQSFIWGPDLKADLKRINDRNKALPSETLEKGIMSFAAKPPLDGDYLTSQLWDKSLTRWRNPEKTVLKPETQKDFVDRMKAFDEAAHSGQPEVDSHSDDADALTVKRRIHKQKGSWFQLPKDFKG